MAKFKIVERKIITMGMMEKTYHIEAESKEQAEKLVEDNEAEDFCMDIDYDIEQSETQSINSEEF